MEGKKVKKSDVHKMLHFAKVTNLMEDSTRVKFHHEINYVKEGKVNFARKTM